MTVNSLSDLKDKLQKEKITVNLFNGLTLDTELGIFFLAQDTLFLNNEAISDKQLTSLIKGDNNGTRST